MDAPRDKKTVLFRAAHPLDGPPSEIDIESLKHVTAFLMDQAAEAVMRQGYDLDDTVVTRELICSNRDGIGFGVELMLSDKTLLVTSINVAAKKAGVAPEALGTVRLEELRISTLHDPLFGEGSMPPV